MFLYSGVRTPIGSFRGSLSTASSVELGATAAREAIKRSGGSDLTVLKVKVLRKVYKHIRNSIGNTRKCGGRPFRDPVSEESSGGK